MVCLSIHILARSISLWAISKMSEVAYSFFLGKNNGVVYAWLQVGIFSMMRVKQLLLNQKEMWKENQAVMIIFQVVIFVKRHFLL
jgi:hypothetical protein